MCSYPLQIFTVYGKIQDFIPFKIVHIVLKHPNDSDYLGPAVLIKSDKKQQLSAVGLWQVMAKTKELGEDLELHVVASHKSGKGLFEQLCLSNPCHKLRSRFDFRQRIGLRTQLRTPGRTGLD